MGSHSLLHSPGELLDSEVEPGFPALQVDSLPSELPGKPHVHTYFGIHQKLTQHCKSTILQFKATTPISVLLGIYLGVKKKRWQEYRKTYKRGPNDPDHHDGVITHLEPGILECEVKWALRSITMNKPSGDNRIMANLFQILRDDTVKVLHSIYQQIWKTQQWPQDWKRSVFIPVPKKGNAKECSNYHTIVLISHACKVMLKILQARLQQYMKVELPDVQSGFRKGRIIRDQIANIHWIIEKAREFQKNTYFCFIDYAKVFDCVDQTNCGKFERDGHTTLLAS